MNGATPTNDEQGQLRPGRRSAGRALWLVRTGALATLLCIAHASLAAVLPEDRADLLYHRFDGGGVTIDGPSLLVRKKLGENYSVNANYYVDMISSASIDVLSSASPYKEKRTQYSLGGDYLRDKTTYSISYIDSDEPDYKAHTASVGLSHDLFGDLTTISMGYSRGWDVVSERSTRSTSPAAVGHADHRNFSVGLSQIVTKRLILGLNYDVITDEGYLKSPYRKIRFCNDPACAAASFADQIYPRTRTSNAVALDARYFLPYRATLHGNYRYFSDTWGIGANTAEIGYLHPTKGPWVFEASYRYYAQTRADFYSDLFPRADFQNFMARDRELATFHSHTFRVGGSYEFAHGGWRSVQKGSLNFYYDRVQFQYEDFRNTLAAAPPGAQPLYSYGANVMQFFVSIWF